MKKALITGASGFIGANLVRYLLSAYPDVEIHALVHPQSDLWRLRAINAKIHIHTISILDKEKIRHFIKNVKPETIFHLAAYGNSATHADASLIIDTIIVGTWNIATACDSFPYRIFVNTGSSSEYGITQKAMKETDALHPTTVYGAAKASASILLSAYAQMTSKPIITLRPFSVYGPWEHPSRFIPTVINRIQSGSAIETTSGTVRHDFIHVEDVCRAYLEAWKRSALLPPGSVINIGSGSETSNAEIIELLSQIARKTVPVIDGKFARRSFDTEHWRADTAVAKRLLSFTHRYTLRLGLEQTYRFYASQRKD